MCEGTTTDDCFFDEFLDEWTEVTDSNTDFVTQPQLYMHFKRMYEMIYKRENVPTMQEFFAWMTRKLGAPNPHWRGIKIIA